MMIQISGLFQAAPPARPGHRVSLGSPAPALLLRAAISLSLSLFLPSDPHSLVIGRAFTMGRGSGKILL